MLKFQVLFRACEKDRRGATSRPFGLNKVQVIKLCFYNLYKIMENNNCKFTIIGDGLSQEMLDFFEQFDVVVDNETMNSASMSLQKQINLALKIPDDEWVYMCEDDYLHVDYAFDYISEFIRNKHEYLETSGDKKNYMNRIIGNLNKKPLVIFPPDYPEGYYPFWKRLSFVFMSKYCHWHQVTNSTHTFLLQARTVKKFEKQISASAAGPSDDKLAESYGRILFRNKMLCISPIKGLSTHMTPTVMTPFIDWEVVYKSNVNELKIVAFGKDT